MDLELKKTASIFDEASQTYAEEFQFIDLEGRKVTIEVPREKCESSELRLRLRAHGADLPELKACRAALATAIEQAATIKRRVAANGWWRDDQGRVVRFGSFGTMASRDNTGSFLPAVFGAGRIGADMRRCGSLDEWKRVVEVAEYSTTMLVALCAAFAAPLLSLTNRPSFGLVLFGPSRCGKTTAQLLAASVIGYGIEEQLPTLDATHAGLLAAGLAFNDHMLPINEVGTARGKKADVAQAVREATYALMSGRDVMRHPSWAGHHDGAASSFKVLPLLSSELSPEGWAERAGETRDAGEMVRLIGLPAVMGRADTVFDQRPGDVPRTQSESWQREQFKGLRDGLPYQRGVAFQEFVSLLVCNPQRYARMIDISINDFEEKVLNPSMSLVERDIASKFAVLAAAGRLAAVWKILPFASEDIDKAIKKGFHAAVAALPDPKAKLKANMAKVKQLLAGSSIIDIKRASARRLENARQADGLVKKTDTGWTFSLRATQLSELLKEEAAVHEVLFAFDDEGLLHHRKTRTAGRSTFWAKTQIDWPDGTRAHSYVFKLPRGLDEFDRFLDPE